MLFHARHQPEAHYQKGSISAISHSCISPAARPRQTVCYRGSRRPPCPSLNPPSCGSQQRRATAWFLRRCATDLRGLRAIETPTPAPDAGTLAPGRFGRTDCSGRGRRRRHDGADAWKGFEKVGVKCRLCSASSGARLRGEIPAPPTIQVLGERRSLVAHMRCRWCRRCIWNTRHIVTAKAWFGGGADLTDLPRSPGRPSSTPRRLACAPTSRTVTPASRPGAMNIYLLTREPRGRGYSSTISTAATGSAISPCRGYDAFRVIFRRSCAR